MLSRPARRVFSIPAFARLLKGLRPFCDPPVLLLSLPRGGSSWIGSILGAAENSYYLREPITQSYQALHPGGPVTFELDACVDRQAYRRFACAAFSGLPAFPPAIRPYRHQQWWARRSRCHMVVKEVNPLVLDWILDEFKPIVVYLIRHPVAVAHSYHSQGWTGVPFERMFTAGSRSALSARYSFSCRDDFWKKIGALQAMVQNTVMDSLQAAPAFKVIQYEEFCIHPAENFERLFRFCGLRMDARVWDLMNRSTSTQGDYRPGQYDTDRNTSDMADRWRSVVGESDIALIKSGYFENSPRFYVSDEEW